MEDEEALADAERFGTPYHEAGHGRMIVRFRLLSPGWHLLVPGAPLWSDQAARRRNMVGAVLPAGGSVDADPPTWERRKPFLSRGHGELDLALRRCAAREAIKCMAGVWAGFPTSRAWSKWHEQSAREDLKNAMRAFTEVGFDPPDVWGTLNEATIELVDREFGAIEAIAIALKRKRQLTSYEVVDLIDSATPRRNPWRPQAPIWLEIDPVECVAQQLECWRRQDWVEADRLAAMNEVES
jgi:hypothetical protein